MRFKKKKTKHRLRQILMIKFRNLSLMAIVVVVNRITKYPMQANHLICLTKGNLDPLWRIRQVSVVVVVNP